MAVKIKAETQPAARHAAGHRLEQTSFFGAHLGNGASGPELGGQVPLSYGHDYTFAIFKKSP